MDTYDLAIIGSGPAGYVAAIKAAQNKMNVVLIEKYSTFGGTCLNVGCIPSKALLHFSHLFHEVSVFGPKIGIHAENITLHFEEMMKAKQEAVEKLISGVTFLLKKNHVTTITGHARFIDPHTLEVNDRKISAKHFFMATGSKPLSLPFLPIDEKRVLSSTGALSLSEVPAHLLIIGGGVIGLELGSVYKRLGSKVTVIEFLDRPLFEFDDSISSTYSKMLKNEGYQLHLSTKVVSGKVDEHGVTLTAEKDGAEATFKGDYCLVAIGRRPYHENLGLEKIGITPDQRGFIPVNHNFQTHHPHILAIGDVIGPPMLAHKGSFEAKAAVNFLLQKGEPLYYATIPNVVYTSPEIASVGFTEKALVEQKIPYKKAEFPFLGNSRYQAVLGKDPCFIKLLSHETTGRLLGAHMIAPHASDIIMEAVIAMQNQLTAHDLATSIHAHPTYSEAFFEASLGLTSSFLHL